MKTPEYDKIHLGCGDFAPRGWVNCDGSWQVWLAHHPWIKRLAVLLGGMSPDNANRVWPQNIVRVDLRGPLPFKENSFQIVYSSNILEHLHRATALALLKDACRCCKSGAIIRTLLPDLEAIISQYLAARVSPNAPAQTPADTFMSRLGMHPAEPPSRRGLRNLYQHFMQFYSHKWMYDERSLIELHRQAGFSNAHACQPFESAIQDIRVVERPDRNRDNLIIEAVKE